MERRLTDPIYLEAVLNRFGFHFQKKLGQNFLIAPDVLDDIVSAAGIGPKDFVLEIGPGVGTMTEALSDKAGKVLAVELDPALIPILEDTLSGRDNVEVMNADIMRVDIDRIVDEGNCGRPIKIAANLPYYITTPILFALLTKHVRASVITVMVQKEVAERMTAGPGTKAYGALSLAVAYYTKAKIVRTVPPEDFIPRPSVESAVVTMVPREESPVGEVNEETLFLLIRAAFQERRKTLTNCISHMKGLSCGKEEAVTILEGLGIDPMIRGEKLSLEEFAEVARRLSDRAE